MLQELIQTHKVAKLDIELTEDTTPENIHKAVREAANEIYKCGMFPTRISVPPAFHEVTWAGINATKALCSMLVGGLPLQATYWSSKGIRHMVYVQADRRLTDSMYVFAEPFSPLEIPGLEWPDNIIEEDDDGKE